MNQKCIGAALGEHDPYVVANLAGCSSTITDNVADRQDHRAVRWLARRARITVATASAIASANRWGCA